MLFANFCSNTKSLQLFFEKWSLNLANFTEKVFFALIHEIFTQTQKHFTQVPLVTNSKSGHPSNGTFEKWLKWDVWVYHGNNENNCTINFFRENHVIWITRHLVTSIFYSQTAQLWLWEENVVTESSLGRCKQEESLSKSVDADCGISTAVASVASCTMARSTIWIMGLYHQNSFDHSVFIQRGWLLSHTP